MPNITAADVAEKKHRIRNWILGTLGALVIGAAGSGLWDLLAKPGLTWMGRSVLNVLTLGSDTIRDSAYQDAALNPGAVPALMSLITFNAVVFGGVFGAMAASLSRIRRMNQALDKRGDAVEEKQDGSGEKAQEEIEILAEERVRARRHERQGYFILTMLGAVFVFLMINELRINQSVLIWRTFTTNLAICAPYLSDQQEKELRAQFSAMRTRADYQPISDRFQQLAASHGLRLVDVSLW